MGHTRYTKALGGGNNNISSNSGGGGGGSGGGIGKGIYACVVGLRMWHPVYRGSQTERKRVVVDVPEPEKFATLREREAAVYEKKEEKEDAVRDALSKEIIQLEMNMENEIEETAKGKK